MRVAVYTLTRDRLEYTKYCFDTLQRRAGYAYDHFVIDNGSQDGTADWLTEEFKAGRFEYVNIHPENWGISRASNEAIEVILTYPDKKYDLIIKMDNDCEVVSENIIGQMVEVFSDIGSLGPAYALSPRVEGIANQPHRGRYTMLSGRRIGLTAIIGGLFMVNAAPILRQYTFPLGLPPAWGQDDHFCNWFKGQGGEVGYVEGLIVNHYETTDGQARRYPEYFKRKWEEEKR